MNLPDQERYLVVFHIIEKYSLQESSEFLGINYDDAGTMLEDAYKRILGALDFIYDINQLLSRIESLPDKIDPPQGVWEQVELAIRKEKTEIREKLDKALDDELKQKLIEDETKEKAIEAEKPKKIKVKKIRRSRVRSGFSFSSLNAAPFLKILLMIIAAATLGYFIFSSAPDWEVSSVYGNVMLNNKPASRGDGLTEQGWITSGKNSVYSLTSHLAVVRGGNSSEVKTKDGKNIELSKGEFNIVKTDEPGEFSAQLFGAELFSETPGTIIHINIETNTAIVKCNKQKLQIHKTAFEFQFPEGYQCDIDKFKGPGLPYNSKTSPIIIRMTKDFSTSASENDVLISGMMPVAAPGDLVTLWNMIKYISPLMRGELFDFMSRVTNLPKDITKNGIIYLDEKMLDKLFTALQPLTNLN